MSSSFNVSPGEFGYILKRQSFLSLQDVLSKCVFAIVKKCFPSSSPKDEIFVHLDLRVQESALQCWDGVLSVSSALHVLSELVPEAISSLLQESVDSQFLSLLQKLQAQLEHGFYGMNSFSSVLLLHDSSFFSQSRQDLLFIVGILRTLLPLDQSLTASIQDAINMLDSCLRLADNPFQLYSSAASSLSCVVCIRALVSLCEAADRHHAPIEVRRNPTRTILWAFTAVSEQGGENPVSPQQFAFLNDIVVELGSCHEEFVSAHMIDAASIISLLLNALKASDLYAASVEMRNTFLDCFARNSSISTEPGSRISLVLQSTSSAISSCPFFASSYAYLQSDRTIASVNHCKTGHVSLPWNEEWRCIDKFSGNVKLLMQIDLCCQILRLVPAFHNKTSREVEKYLCESHAPVVIRNVTFALDQVKEGCTGIMGMLTSCGHALAKILSPDSDVFVDGKKNVSFDASSDDGVFPLLVHVVLARLRGGYSVQSCPCVKGYSSVFNQASSPSTHAILSDFISGKVSLDQSMDSTSSEHSFLHITDAVVHLDDLASRLHPSHHASSIKIPIMASPVVSDQVPPSIRRKHDLFVKVWDSEALIPDAIAGPISPAEFNTKELIVSDEEVDSAADYFSFSSILSHSGNNFRFFLLYGERGTGKTFHSIQVVKRIQASRQSRALNFHWKLIDCKSPESARSSFIQSVRVDFNINDKFDLRAPPHEVAAALSKYLDGIPFLYILDDASPAGLEYMLRNLPHSSEPHGVIVTSTCISPSQLWDFAASFQQRVDPKSMRPSVQSIRLQNYDDDVVIRVANAIGLPCGDDEVVRALHETCIYTAHVPITVVMLFRFFRRKQIQMTASSHSHSSSTSKAVVRSITEWRDIAESLDESEHRGLQAAVRLVLKELRELHDRDLMIDCFIILGMLMHCPTFTSQHFFIQHFAPDSPFFFTNPDPLQSYPPKDVGAELCSDVERGFRAIRTLSELGFVRLLQVKLNNPGDYYFVTIMPHMIQSLLKQELQESGSIYSAINLSNVIPLHVGDLTNDSVYDNQIPSIRRVLSTCEHCLSVILSVSPQLLIWVCGVFLRIARIYQVMDYDPESQRRMLVSFRNTIAKHSDASEVQDLRLRAHLYGGDEFSEQALLDIDAVSNENSSEVMATALNNIGCMFNSDGEYARALQYYHKALSIQLQHFGENFPFVGTMYTNVGIALDHLERHDEAMEYFQKALAIRKATLSDTHPQVALSYIDIGQAFSRQGRHTTALEQYNLALSIQVNHYGDRHKLVASTLSFIGCCYDRLAQPLKAIEYQKQVLDIQTSVLPSGSSELSATYNNIASGLSKIGQHGESIKYFTEALNIRKSIHGPRSPELSVMYNNIGSAYHYKCDNKRSLEYFTRALEIDLEHGKTLGAASGFNNIAGCVDSFKKEENQKALDFYTRGLELLLRHHGSRHPDIATTLANIGLAHYRIGTKALLELAIQMYHRCLSIRLEFIPLINNDFASVFVNLSWIYERNEDFETALKYSRRALIIKIQSKGYWTYDIAHILLDMSEMFKRVGKMDDAVNLVERTVAIFVFLDDPNLSSKMADALFKLALVYEKKYGVPASAECVIEALRVLASNPETCKSAILTAVKMHGCMLYMVCRAGRFEECLSFLPVIDALASTFVDTTMTSTMRMPHVNELVLYWSASAEIYRRCERLSHAIAAFKMAAKFAANADTYPLKSYFQTCGLTQEKDALLKTAERLAKLEASHRKQGVAAAEFPKISPQPKSLCLRLPVAAYKLEEIDAEPIAAIPSYEFPKVSACALPLPPDSPKPVLLLRSCPLKNAPPVTFPEFAAFTLPKLEHMQLEALSRVPTNPRNAGVSEPSGITVSLHHATSSRVSLESFTPSQSYASFPTR